MELGAGNGDWILSKAREGAGRVWVCAELRLDRAWEIWSRAVLSNVTNVVVVCAESTSLLQKHCQPASVSVIWVRFPQPSVSIPHGQLWADRRHAESERDNLTSGGRGHMMTSSLFRAAASGLLEGGTMEVATDSLEYAR